MTDYIVATVKPWNIAAFHRYTPELPGRWHLITAPDALTAARLADVVPRYVFFPHWSRHVPDDILESYECVCFHMTDLPYGRGGSPLQNLIQRGHNETQLCALRMMEQYDAGPIYLRRPLSLSGRAQEIYERCAELIYEMIREIIVSKPQPQPQKGDPVQFRRRNPEQSRLPEHTSDRALYDHIRMLDAETYPRAFLEHGRWRLEFSHASLDADGLQARVTFHLQLPDDQQQWRKRYS